MIYEEVLSFYKNYKGPKCVIGYSLRGRAIVAMHAGEVVGRQYISTYAIHGREWITARLALAHLARPAACGGWIVPLVNPDGAVISQSGLPMWKANARGVDLNVNFDAEWGRGALNTRTPGGSNYIGPEPFSESESKALAAFTLKVGPFVTFSFHTKGGEVYWQFMGGGDRRGAELLAAATGYKIKLTPGSAGGYKDWCIQKLGIPAYTVECGSDGLSHPICRLADIAECRSALRYFFLHYGK